MISGLDTSQSAQQTSIPIPTQTQAAPAPAPAPQPAQTQTQPQPHVQAPPQQQQAPPPPPPMPFPDDIPFPPPSFQTTPTPANLPGIHPSLAPRPPTGPAPLPSLSERPSPGPMLNNNLSDDDDNDAEDNQDENDEEEDGSEEGNSDNTIEEGTTLYYLGQEAILDPDNLPDLVKFYTTLAQCEREVLERWKHYTVLMYNCTEDFEADSIEPVDEEDWLYKELEMPRRPEVVMVDKENMSKLQQTEVLPLIREYVAIRTNIDKRRFARLDKGTMLYSANSMAITDPKPKEGEPGCFFYTTLALPQEAVLQDRTDKVLNSYYVNRNLVLPYGADDERDEYFNDKYNDVLKEDEEEEQVVTSYYDDTIEGEYVPRDEDSAEVFLVEKDLDAITYFGSQDMKLHTVQFIHGIERDKGI